MHEAHILVTRFKWRSDRAQGTDKVKKLHAAIATEAQKYIASMYEVHDEVQQLRDNLREEHRVWTDLYSTVFRV